MGLKRLWVDIETYSETDLLKHGVYRYTEDPAFRIILVAFAFDDGPVHCWSYEQADPHIDRCVDEVWAHNVCARQFDTAELRKGKAWRIMQEDLRKQVAANVLRRLNAVIK